MLCTSSCAGSVRCSCSATALVGALRNSGSTSVVCVLIGGRGEGKRGKRCRQAIDQSWASGVHACRWQEFWPGACAAGKDKAFTSLPWEMKQGRLPWQHEGVELHTEAALRAACVLRPRTCQPSSMIRVRGKMPPLCRLLKPSAMPRADTEL